MIILMIVVSPDGQELATSELEVLRRRRIALSYVALIAYWEPFKHWISHLTLVQKLCGVGDFIGGGCGGCGQELSIKIN